MNQGLNEVQLDSLMQDLSAPLASSQAYNYPKVLEASTCTGVNLQTHVVMQAVPLEHSASLGNMP